MYTNAEGSSRTWVPGQGRPRHELSAQVRPGQTATLRRCGIRRCDPRALERFGPVGRDGLRPRRPKAVDGDRSAGRPVEESAGMDEPEGSRGLPTEGE